MLKKVWNNVEKSLKILEKSRKKSWKSFGNMPKCHLTTQQENKATKNLTLKNNKPMLRIAPRARDQKWMGFKENFVFCNAAMSKIGPGFSNKCTYFKIEVRFFFLSTKIGLLDWYVFFNEKKRN